MQEFVQKVSFECSLLFCPHRRFIQNEKFVAPADGHNTAGQFTPKNHGYKGALSVSLPGFKTPIDDRVIATTKELAAEFPFNQDMAGGDVLGIGEFGQHKLHTILLMSYE